MHGDSANPLLLQWIKEWYDEAKERNSKGANIYKKAYESMKACPLTFNHPSEAQQLHGLGPKLCDRLTEKLEAHCTENGLPIPKISRNARKRLSADELSAINPEVPAKKCRKPKSYVPSLRSGPYALILALSSLAAGSAPGLTKAQLIEQAQEHCDSSFTAPIDASKFYTAWNSMKTLIDKDLVYERGRPLRRYYLTDEGMEVAKRINTVQEAVDQSEETNMRSLTTFQRALSPITNFECLESGHDPDTLEPQLPQINHDIFEESEQTKIPNKACSGRRLGGSMTDKYGTFSSPKERDLPPKLDPTLHEKFIELLSSPEIQPSQKVVKALPAQRLAGKISTTGLKERLNTVGPELQPQETRAGSKTAISMGVQAINLQPGTFTVQLVLDNREVRTKTDRDYMYDELTKMGVSTLVRPLELGDFFWIAKCNDPGLLASYGEEGDEIALDWIVERKRLDDLVESIKDGRFDEQKFRLRRSGVQNVVYIIEEYSMSAERVSNYNEAIDSAIASTQVVDGYFIKRTLKLDDTMCYLARMTGMLKTMYETKPLHIIPTSLIEPETYLPLFNQLRSQTPNIHHNITYSSFASLASKSDSLTLRDVFLRMLMCARGITGDKALEIQKCWETPRALTEALEGCEGAKEREAMMDVVLGGKIGRKKMGKAACAKIVEIWGEA